MADVSSLLLASLAPETRHQAEQQLNVLSSQPGFLVALLALVLDRNQQQPTRLAASLFFKNIVRKRWEEDDQPIPETEKAQVRSELVSVMISLSTPKDKPIRAQIAETVSIAAKYDFPQKWENLIDQLVSSLSPSIPAYSTNLSVLETAHSIFGRWRSETRTDALFSTINFVLSRFMEPFLQIFRHTATVLLNTPPDNMVELVAMAQTQVVLESIFYDLTCQDLPPAIEDAHTEFFGPEGWFIRFLQWSPKALEGDAGDTTPSISSQVKSQIFEIAEFYIHRFPELLADNTIVETLVQAVWTLASDGKHVGVAYDGLVAQALRFLSAAVRSGNYKHIFASKQTISTLVDGVVVPNSSLREHEVEQFEDDPMEYIRLDLSIPVGGSSLADGTTRRQAAAELLRALVASGFEVETTEVVGGWVVKGLEQYAKGPTAEGAWQAKDVATYLFTAVASRGSTSQHGVTSVNTLVDVVKFFSDHIYQDLQAQTDSVHPILQVDAIRFLYTFRNQLTKEQHLSVLPLLLRHIGSDNYVCYSYAAIAIERILFMKQGAQLLFGQNDIREIAPEILNAALKKVEGGKTPEKIAENDYMMKCVMRIIFTARQTLLPTYERILQRLVAILSAICKNPSNPNFDQYLFESLSALIRFMVAENAQTLPTFEKALFGPLVIIIQQDIDQFVPYSFQILSQMLELHHGQVPPEYREMLPYLLQPASWQQRGSIPGLVRLLKVFIKGDAAKLVSTGQFMSILAVVQQKLIPSKLNDVWGFQLLESILLHIPRNALQPYIKDVLTILLTRLHTSKTDSYSRNFVQFLMFAMCVDENGMTSDFVISAIEEIQQQLWSQLLANIILTEIPKTIPKDRKVTAVGLVKMLTQSRVMLMQPSVAKWPDCLSALVKLFSDPQLLKNSQTTSDDAVGFTMVDLEEQNAGYQVAYSKLSASETSSEDPTAGIPDIQEFVRKAFRAAITSNPQYQTLLQLPESAVGMALLKSLNVL